MKLTKLLALLIVLVLSLSACTKSALRKDLLEYVKFEITMHEDIESPKGFPEGLLLGFYAPFEENKEKLLDTAIEVLEKWRTFKIDDARMQNLIDLKVQEWELHYAAYEKLDETMLVANHNTWEDHTSQSVEARHQELRNVREVIDSLVDGRLSAVQQEHKDAFDILIDKTNFFNSKLWKEYQSTLPHDF